MPLYYQLVHNLLPLAPKHSCNKHGARKCPKSAYAQTDSHTDTPHSQTQSSKAHKHTPVMMLEEQERKMCEKDVHFTATSKAGLPLKYRKGLNHK